MLLLSEVGAIAAKLVAGAAAGFSIGMILFSGDTAVVIVSLFVARSSIFYLWNHREKKYSVKLPAGAV
jgi:hypothetical protein